METFKCLTVRQPYADLLTEPVFQDETGLWRAMKSIEVRTCATSYRGDLLITSGARGTDGHPGGVLCGIVELYGVKRVEDFDEDDWKATCLPAGEQPAKGYGWLMRDPRRAVVPLPVKGRKGIFTQTFGDGEVGVYPRYLHMGREGWRRVFEALRKKR